MNNITLPEISELLRSRQKIALFSHISPDGDTVGSVVGLACLLESLGKEVICLCADPIPEYIAFVGADRFQTDFTGGSDWLTVTVDVASPQLLGAMEERFAHRIDLRIDHHAFGSDFAARNYCDPNAAAACEIIAILAGELGGLTEKAAAALYVGLSTDTGSFRYSSTTPRTLRIAADLLDAGAPAEDINDRLYENMSLDMLRTNAFFLENHEMYDGGKILLIPIEEEKRIAAGIAEDALDGMSSLARKIIGVQLGISLRQREPGVYKVSMRAGKHVDCARLCALFGGGGHLRAAGATIRADSFDEAKKMLMDAVVANIRYESGETPS